ncbi:MAG TPA: metallophosphoesterase [bacterium]|nr:metallophosphoesterase [bacterium]
MLPLNSQVIFLLLAMGISASVYGYVGWRTIGPARLRSSRKRALWGLLAVFWVLPPLPLVFRPLGNASALVDELSWVAFLSLGFFVLAFCLLVAADLARLALALVRSLLRNTAQSLATDRSTAHDPDDAGAAMVMGRRGFLGHAANLGLLGTSGALVGYGLDEAMQMPAVVHIRLHVPHLPPALEGFRIAQLTDLHLGPMLKGPFMGRVVERTNALEPDLIALTGDLVDGTVPHLRDAVQPLASLAAREGTCFVTGNHEYYSGVEPWVEHLDGIGVHVLQNAHRLVRRGSARLLVAGVNDPTGARFMGAQPPDLSAAMAGAGDTDFKLLLAHQPLAIYDAAREGFDLQLSGHTHGGQFFPWNLVVGLFQPYVRGLHLHAGTWIYVSKGTGFWGPPMRLGTHSEITLIELTGRAETRVA